MISVIWNLNKLPSSLDLASIKQAAREFARRTDVPPDCPYGFREPRDRYHSRERSREHSRDLASSLTELCHFGRSAVSIFSGGARTIVADDYRIFVSLALPLRVLHLHPFRYVSPILRRPGHTIDFRRRYHVTRRKDAAVSDSMTSPFRLAAA